MDNLPRKQQTLLKVLDRLVEIGWIEKSGLFTAGGRRKPEVRIIWTEQGKARVAAYLPIFKEFGYPSKGEFDMFNDLLVETLREWASR